MKNCPKCGFRIVSVEPLTKHQTTIYRYLVEYTRENRYAPSFEEIAERFGYRSLATVHEHLSNLERKGYITRSFNEARGISCVVNLDEIGPVSGAENIEDDDDDGDVAVSHG